MSDWIRTDPPASMFGWPNAWVMQLLGAIADDLPEQVRERGMHATVGEALRRLATARTAAQKHLAEVEAQRDDARQERDMALTLVTEQQEALNHQHEVAAQLRDELFAQPALEWGPDMSCLDWHAAHRLAEGNSHNGWRLPTLAELTAQFDYATCKPQGEGWMPEIYWAAEACNDPYTKDSDLAWALWFKYGDQVRGFKDTMAHRVRLVRNRVGVVSNG